MKYRGLNYVDSDSRPVYKTKRRAKGASARGRTQKGSAFKLVAAFVLVLGAFVFSLFGGSAAREVYASVREVVFSESAINTFKLLDKIPFFDEISASMNLSDSENLDAAIEASARPEDYTLPVRAREYKVEGSVVEFIDSVGTFVYACEDGIIKNIYEEEGMRVIEIKHGGGIVSKYIGIKVAGVKKGQKIKRGDVIASINEGQNLKFSVIYKGKPLNLNFLEGGKLSCSIE